MMRPECIAPDFVVIGAMKSATTTLYEQLVRQPGIFMPELKEPNFFSDDAVYAKGLAWYLQLFSGAKANDLVGEASTHYTKLPNHPNTIARLAALPVKPKFIYVMRHPIDRLLSHYHHGWSMREITVPLTTALTQHPELVDYGRYAMQLEPWLEAFGRESVLPVFFDRLKQSPQEELERISGFIGYPGHVTWQHDLAPSNVSSERVRRFPGYGLLVDSNLATWLRRGLVPKAWRTAIRERLTVKERPSLTVAQRDQLAGVFDEDLATLGNWLGVQLDCANFKQVTVQRPLDWVGPCQ